jgi:hypothetical protein
MIQHSLAMFRNPPFLLKGCRKPTRQDSMAVAGELARPAAEMQRGSAPRAAVLARRRRSPDGRRVGWRGPQESRGEGWGRRLRVLELEAGVIRDLGFGRVYIPDVGDGPLAGQFNGLSSCQQINRVVPVPALRATMAAQALALRRVVPGTGTIDIVSCRARVVLFRTVLVPAHRARAKWPTILVGGMWERGQAQHVGDPARRRSTQGGCLPAGVAGRARAATRCEALRNAVTLQPRAGYQISVNLMNIMLIFSQRAHAFVCEIIVQ